MAREEVYLQDIAKRLDVFIKALPGVVNFVGPMIFLSCVGCNACYVSETTRHFCVYEHQTMDRNSHIGSRDGAVVLALAFWPPTWPGSIPGFVVICGLSLLLVLVLAL